MWLRKQILQIKQEPKLQRTGQSTIQGRVHKDNKASSFRNVSKGFPNVYEGVRGLVSQRLSSLWRIIGG